MALWTRKERGPESQPQSISEGELVQKYSFVDIDETSGTVLVQKRKQLFKEGKLPAPRLEKELGTSNPSSLTSWIIREYNTDLQGQAGLEKFDRMRRSDGVTRGTLRLVKTPVLAADWYVEPGDETPEAQEAADFITKCLTEYMTIPWSQVVLETLLMLDFGYYLWEKVFTQAETEWGSKIVWQKLAPRHPMDVIEWQYDGAGGPRAVKMNSAKGDSSEEIIIPVEKLLAVTFDKEAGNIEGISVLRSAYKHWYYKENLYKIDAIQKERHGIGIPVVVLPLGYKDEDKQAANVLGANIRTNERAFITLPPGWEVYMLKLEGNVVDALKSVEAHNKEIQANILAELAHNKQGQDLFLKAVGYVAQIITDSFNAYAIKQLVDFNYSDVAYPKLKARKIGEQVDQRTQSFALRNYIGAGVIKPDDELEKAIRRQMDLPPVDEATTREVATPQAPKAPEGQGRPGQPKPPRVGPPRQSPAGGMRQQARGTGKSNAGRDASGGK